MQDNQHTKTKGDGIKQVRAALERGESLTSLDAFRLFDLHHLASTIRNLRINHGLAINSERVEVRNRHGEVCHVARYSLAGKAPEAGDRQ